MAIEGEEGPPPTTPRARVQQQRTARQISDQAIKENKINERLLYGFAITFVTTGTIALLWGMFQNQGFVALAGGISNLLFFPAMREARQIRRENIAIRLLESPLGMSQTAHEAADALREFFVSTFISNKAGVKGG